MVQKDFWVSVLKRLKPTIKKACFITWFQNTTVFDRSEDGVVILGVPNTYAENWIKNRYHLKVLQAMQEIDTAVVALEYQVSDLLNQKGNILGVDVMPFFREEDDKKVRKVRNVNEVKVYKGQGTEAIVSRMLNHRYTLNNFVIGKDNRLPHAACQAVSHTPGGIYNPLYIYGTVGLGKTHLLQAVGNEILRNYPDMVVKYITAEKFVTEVVEAIGKRHMKQFKDQYRNVDCFLVDDVQFFARKDSSQQEFFHTFNELYDGNKQIILTSDRPPSELQDLDERLVSRFGMGMVVEMIMPDFETRLAILQNKCSEFEMIIDPEVLSFIASNVQNSVRELEGVLKQVVAEVQIFDRVPTISSVADIIRRLNKAQEIIGFDIEAKKANFRVKTEEEVMKIVAEYYNVSVDDLTGNNRHKEYMLPRQVCMYLIKNELNESYEKIGRGFGGRNHTTVMHACGKTAKRLRTDVKLVRDVNCIKREMGL